MKTYIETHYPTATHTVWDHGYYNNPIERSTPETDRPTIAVCHSLGFTHAVQSGFAFNAMVCLQGFTWFCSPEKGLPGVPKAQIVGLKGLFAVVTNPTPLKPFFKMAGIDLTTTETLNRTQVLADLDMLEKCRVEWPECPVLTITSDDDLIVPTKITEFQASNAPQVTVKKINGVKHALGYLQETGVVESIDQWLATQ